MKRSKMISKMSYLLNSRIGTIMDEDFFKNLSYEILEMQEKAGMRPPEVPNGNDYNIETWEPEDEN